MIPRIILLGDTGLAATYVGLAKSLARQALAARLTHKTWRGAGVEIRIENRLVAPIWNDPVLAEVEPRLKWVVPECDPEEIVRAEEEDRECEPPPPMLVEIPQPPRVVRDGFYGLGGRPSSTIWVWAEAAASVFFGLGDDTGWGALEGGITERKGQRFPDDPRGRWKGFEHDEKWDLSPATDCGRWWVSSRWLKRNRFSQVISWTNNRVLSNGKDIEASEVPSGTVLAGFEYNKGTDDEPERVSATILRVSNVNPPTLRMYLWEDGDDGDEGEWVEEWSHTFPAGYQWTQMTKVAVNPEATEGRVIMYYRPEPNLSARVEWVINLRTGNFEEDYNFVAVQSRTVTHTVHQDSNPPDFFYRFRLISHNTSSITVGPVVAPDNFLPLVGWYLAIWSPEFEEWIRLVVTGASGGGVGTSSVLTGVFTKSSDGELTNPIAAQFVNTPSILPSESTFVFYLNTTGVVIYDESEEGVETYTGRSIIDIDYEYLKDDEGRYTGESVPVKLEQVYDRRLEWESVYFFENGHSGELEDDDYTLHSTQEDYYRFIGGSHDGETIPIHNTRFNQNILPGGGLWEGRTSQAITYSPVVEGNGLSGWDYRTTMSAGSVGKHQYEHWGPITEDPAKQSPSLVAYDLRFGLLLSWNFGFSYDLYINRRAWSGPALDGPGPSYSGVGNVVTGRSPRFTRDETLENYTDYFQHYLHKGDVELQRSVGRGINGTAITDEETPTDPFGPMGFSYRRAGVYVTTQSVQQVHSATSFPRAMATDFFGNIIADANEWYADEDDQPHDYDSWDQDGRMRYIAVLDDEEIEDNDDGVIDHDDPGKAVSWLEGDEVVNRSGENVYPIHWPIFKR